VTVVEVCGLVDIDVVGGHGIEHKGTAHLTFGYVKTCDSFDGSPKWVMPAKVKLGPSDGKFVRCIAYFADGGIAKLPFSVALYAEPGSKPYVHVIEVCWSPSWLLRDVSTRAILRRGARCIIDGARCASRVNPSAPWTPHVVIGTGSGLSLGRCVQEQSCVGGLAALNQCECVCHVDANVTKAWQRERDEAACSLIPDIDKKIACVLYPSVGGNACKPVPVCTNG
jgi:hypothetical protein